MIFHDSNVEMVGFKWCLLSIERAGGFYLLGESCK